MPSYSVDYNDLADNIYQWGKSLGFSQVGISDLDLSQHESALQNWLDNNYHGNMAYMARHGLKRARPKLLLPGSLRAICVRLDYLPSDTKFVSTLSDKNRAYISRYALGRDYHKLMRKRLQQLGEKISVYCEQLNFRPFVDSAPILERPLAEKAGLGWVGKHTLLINKAAGSWFFLGELLVDIPLPVTIKVSSSVNSTANDCGKCVACINICPTKAIVAPYVVDARRCISYFTIESPDAIPVELRPMMGNRIFGCDDCQLICPWNKYAKLSLEKDFQVRLNLNKITLLELFSWNESQFLSRLQGSPIRRIGFQRWQRNIAVALGNAPYNSAIVNALQTQLTKATTLVAEHICWAINRQLEHKKNDAQHSELHTIRLIRSIKKRLPQDS